MGIDINGARFLLFAKSSGVDFTATAMIGRQQIHFSQDDITRLFSACGRKIDNAEIIKICHGDAGYAGNFLRYLGAHITHSFDCSDYEDPTYIHDMNAPMPEHFKENYTVVLDGGSLEHIFNFPTAIKNCMEMTTIGGHYLAITPANNFFGHGFYQFSPELYFTVFSAENGFEVKKIIAFEDIAKPLWYVVKNPQEVARRVTLNNCSPVYLLIIAKRTDRVSIFKCPPQQSDYVRLWNAQKNVLSNVADEPVHPSPSWLRAQIVLPVGLRIMMHRILRGAAPNKRGFDPHYFEEMNWPETIDGTRAVNNR